MTKDLISRENNYEYEIWNLFVENNGRWIFFIFFKMVKNHRVCDS